MATPDNPADWASRPKHQEAYRAPNQAELEALYRNSRLSLPWVLRLPLATTLSFFAGFTLGASFGGKMTGLRFRAEHAHKMPSSSTGWYLYHKSKNYQVAYGGLREGFRMGFKVSFWTTAMFAIERMFDVYRGTSDMFNTLTSCVTVAGGFSLWSMLHDVFALRLYIIPANTCVPPTDRFSLPMTARTTQTALVAGVVYGGLQDVLGLIRGRPIGYVDWARQRLGYPPQPRPMPS
ncbi:hypothetical protein B0J18DRAFT_119 [Chaetomium sp. MPI-SDFR-AT-0129]|nr:hypothetical protein B0J18DRAFT_119 [Chaetomium sp. MPI-SDFR-AT-0129]